MTTRPSIIGLDEHIPEQSERAGNHQQFGEDGNAAICPTQTSGNFSVLLAAPTVYGPLEAGLIPGRQLNPTEAYWCTVTICKEYGLHDSSHGGAIMHDTGENVTRATNLTLRAGAGLLFMFHGAQKLFGWFGGVDQAGATVELASKLGVAGVLELVGGALIVIGLFAQPVALVLVAEMLIAYFQVHAPQGLAPLQNQGELALLYALIFLYFAGHGAGAFSIDALRNRTRRTDVWVAQREEGRPEFRRRRAS